MQQPPYGRPPSQPYRPPGNPPPQSSAGYAQAHGYPGAAPGVPAAPAARKRRGSLRFLASTCVFSAWLTLVVSVLLALWSFVSAAGASHLTALVPSTPVVTAPMPVPGESGSGDEIPGMGGGGLGLPGISGSGGIPGVGGSGGSPLVGI